MILVVTTDAISTAPSPRLVAPMKVLAVATYPNEAAATRFRLTQFIAPLAERGIALDVRPFLDASVFASLYRPSSSSRTALRLFRAALRRIRDTAAARSVDAVLVQREAMLMGPPLFEYLVSEVLAKPTVLDLDDATYLRYTSPTHGRLAGALKWSGKTDNLIRLADVVTCGNRSIAEYVSKKGARALIIPTVVDTGRFRPGPSLPRRDPAVIGWVGSHSTYPYLESIIPVLERLARTRRFRLRIIGSGREEIRIPGVDVECLSWSLEREVADFQSLDLGLYPIVADEWSAGKSGFKSIQYMAVGIPFVVSPVGACAEIGEPGITHYCASSQGQWHAALDRLLSHADLRRSMGEAGRKHVLQHYTVAIQADKLAGAIRLSMEKGRHPPLASPA